MELLLKVDDLEPLPNPKSNIHNKPMGLLTSKYKEIVNSNFKNSNEHSLFGNRQIIKRSFYRSSSFASAACKLSLFLLVFLMVLI